MQRMEMCRMEFGGGGGGDPHGDHSSCGIGSPPCQERVLGEGIAILSVAGAANLAEEFPFMIASIDNQVPLSRLRDDSVGVSCELQRTRDDDIGFPVPVALLSQFPGEREFLFPPLTVLEFAIPDAPDHRFCPSPCPPPPPHPCRGALGLLRWPRGSRPQSAALPHTPRSCGIGCPMRHEPMRTDVVPRPAPTF